MMHPPNLCAQTRSRAYIQDFISTIVHSAFVEVGFMSEKNWLESLEAVLVFTIPLLLAIPLYALGFLTDVLGNYALYSIYIAGSIIQTKYNGRSLAEIGLTRKGLLPSLGNSVLLVATALVTRFVGAGLELSSDANSLETVIYNLLFW